MTHIGPYVNFQGRAREAMEFYHSLLGGQLELLGMDQQGALGPAGPDDRIAHARLDAEGVFLTGSDGHPKFPPTVGDNMAIYLSGANREQLAATFNALAEGGTIKGRLSTLPGGSGVGYLIDRFGINWIVSVDPA